FIRPDGTVDVPALLTLINDLRKACVTLWDSGTSAQRPVDPLFSQLYFDITTAQYLYCSAIRNGAVPAQWTPFGTGGGGAAGTVTSITATTPIVVAPNPIAASGTVSHANSGVSAATYGDAANYPVLTVDAKGNVTSASEQALPTSSGTVTSISADAPIAVSPAPIAGVGTVSHS